MIEKESLSERLLDAWLNLSMQVWNERFVYNLSYNESLVCHLLYKKSMETPDAPYLTLMQLSHHTGILKSQMNKTLTSLETRGIISKIRSTQDKRVVFISLNTDRISAYEEQHRKIIEVVERIIDRLGIARSKQAIEIFNDIGSEITRILQSS